MKVKGRWFIIFLQLILIVATGTIGLMSLVLYFMTKNREEKDKNKGYYKKKRKGLKFIREGDMFKRVDSYLKESGYILTAEVFILAHILAVVFIIYGSLMLGFQQTSRTIMPVFFMLLFLVHLLINNRTRDRRNRVRIELCNIQDVMYFQNKIGTAEDIILTHAARIANSPLKEPLEYLATAPKVKKTVEAALEELRQVSDIVELQSFSFILQQRQFTGSTIENHKAQAQMMKRNKRLRRRIERQYKRTKLMVAALMLFACYVLLLTVPLFIEAMRGLELLFR